METRKKRPINLSKKGPPKKRHKFLSQTKLIENLEHMATLTLTEQGPTRKAYLDFERAKKGDSIHIMNALRYRQKLAREQKEPEGYCVGLSILLLCSRLKTGSPDDFFKTVSPIVKCPIHNLPSIKKEVADFVWPLEVFQEPEHYFKEEKLTQGRVDKMIKKVTGMDVTQRVKTGDFSARQFERELQGLSEDQTVLILLDVLDSDYRHAIEVFRKGDTFFCYDSSEQIDGLEKFAMTFPIKRSSLLFDKIKDVYFSHAPKKRTDLYKLNLELITIEPKKLAETEESKPSPRRPAA